MSKANLCAFIWLLVVWPTEKVAFQSIPLSWRKEIIELAQYTSRYVVRHGYQKIGIESVLYTKIGFFWFCFSHPDQLPIQSRSVDQYISTQNSTLCLLPLSLQAFLKTCQYA